MRNRNDAPCYNCADRDPGCHSKCEIYKEWKDQMVSICTKIRRNRMFNGEEGDIVKVEVARRRAKKKVERRLKGK